MSKHKAREGEPSPTTPNTPPTPPFPPIPPIPPIKIETLFDLAKIVLVVVIWYITTNANSALMAGVDYGKIAESSSSLLSASFKGAMIGLLQGLILSVQALITIWASPTLFLYLGPVLTAALKTPIKLVAEFRSALSPRKGDDPDKKPADEQDKKPAAEH
ncbi:MAG: hypothetical protein K2X27_26045 [Candidatus Obscuribacterales bacterium]|nr:hypothetical protein [Candidatus Obscuribacterales bacterium]